MKGAVGFMATMFVVLAAYLLRWRELRDRILLAEEDGHPDQAVEARARLRKETRMTALVAGVLLAAGVVCWIVRQPS